MSFVQLSFGDLKLDVFEGKEDKERCTQLD
jgi:hypothetical protein